MLKTKDIKKIFGERVKFYRNKRNLTQAQLAEKTSLDPSFIGKIEIGVTFVSVDNLCKLCNVLKVKPYELLFDSLVKPYELLFDSLEENESSSAKKAIIDSINNNLKYFNKDKLSCISNIVDNIKNL